MQHSTYFPPSHFGDVRPARNDLLTKGMKFIAASPEAKQSIERAGQDFWKDWAKRPGPVAEEMRQVAQKIISGK